MEDRHYIEIGIVLLLAWWLYDEWQSLTESISTGMPKFNLLFPFALQDSSAFGDGIYGAPGSLDANGYPVPFLPAQYKETLDANGYPVPYAPAGTPGATTNLNANGNPIVQYKLGFDDSGYPTPYYDRSAPAGTPGATTNFNPYSPFKLDQVIDMANKDGAYCPTDPNLSENINGLEGLATYYAPGVAGTGHITANGEYFDGTQMTAASPYISNTNKRPKYPFGTMIRVTALNTGNSVVVRINDTGAFGTLRYAGRVIDLSPAAMKALTGRLGSVEVRLDIV